MADRATSIFSHGHLRNLRSISLRNLSLADEAPGRKRTKTIDDDALPQTLQSPAKLLSLREQRGLEQARSASSVDLRAVLEDGEAGVNGEAENDSPTKSKARPAVRPAKLRRRSTLEWTNATPQKRQEKLEGLTREKLADVCFSLHVAGVEEPVYVSEVVENTMNPTFRHIDFSGCAPGVTRQDAAIVRIWIKSGRRWRQLSNIRLSLRELSYIGHSLESLPFQSLPPNTLLFHMQDGIYATSSAGIQASPMSSQRTNNTRALPTSSFDALLRLGKLDDSIQDAILTQRALASDLEKLLQANKEALTLKDKVAEADDRLKTIEYAKRTVLKQLARAKKGIDEKQASIDKRRALMLADRDAQGQQTLEIRRLRQELPASHDGRGVRRRAIANQQRRICEDLRTIYSIAPVPGKSLTFTIRSLLLPDADGLDDQPPEKVAAALGYVAHIVTLLSAYLTQPLIYPTHARNSSSTITDLISLLKTTGPALRSDQQRTYPLFSQGVPRFRFEYAVFLLNKNIQLLLESVYQVRGTDVRQTLPNLKYLLYVATAGEGELPERKAGGVKGLIGKRDEREGSVDSRASTLVEGRAIESLRRNVKVEGKKKV